MAYLKKANFRGSGRTYISMAQGYRDKERGHTRTKTIESFGYVDELKKVYDDPIAHFQKVVDDYNLADEQEAAEYTIAAKKDKELDQNTSSRKNYGYIVIMNIDFHAEK